MLIPFCISTYVGWEYLSLYDADSNGDNSSDVRCSSVTIFVVTATCVYCRSAASSTDESTDDTKDNIGQ